MKKLFKMLGLVLGGSVLFFVVVGAIALLDVSNDPPEGEKPQAVVQAPQDTIIIKKGCAYALSPDPIKKLKVLLDSGDGEATDLAFKKLLDSGELIEVVNPRLEIRIIDRTMAPIFKVDMGGHGSMDTGRVC